VSPERSYPILIRFVAPTLLIWFTVCFVFAATAPMRHRAGIWLRPTSAKVAHALESPRRTAIVLTR